MPISRKFYNTNRKDEVFDVLRREILAARLKVTLDEELQRPTSTIVKQLAGMKLPPIIPTNPGDNERLTML